MEEFRIFGFPVRTYILSYFENNLADELIEQFKQESILHEETHTKTGFWSKSQQILKELKLKELTNEIHSCIEDYRTQESHIVEDIEIVSSWFNILQPEQYIEPHVHLNSYISGTIHLNEGSNLFFKKPSVESVFQLHCEIENVDSQFIEYVPQPGSLVLFPSTLSHGVYPHNREDARFSLAFNTWPRYYGSSTRHVNLR